MNLKTVTGAAVELSEVAFGREFNEALVHQVVTAYLVVLVKVLVHKKLVAKFTAVARSHGVKKVLAVRVAVLSVAQSGLAVVVHSLLSHKTGHKK